MKMEYAFATVPAQPISIRSVIWLDREAESHGKVLRSLADRGIEVRTAHDVNECERLVTEAMPDVVVSPLWIDDADRNAVDVARSYFRKLPHLRLIGATAVSSWVAYAATADNALEDFCSLLEWLTRLL
jgi:DNA-binding NtrC family response regulator